jgi:small-conductance mechanosensitive channel
MPSVLATSNGSSPGYLYQILRLLGIHPDRASSLSSLLTRPLAAVIILLSSLLAGWLIRRLIDHAIGGAVQAGVKRERSKVRAATIAHAVARLVRGVIVLAGIVLALGALGINLAPFVAGATIVGAVVAFGAQNLIKDYLAGLLLVLEDQIAVGDKATIGSVTGTVEAFSLRITSVRDEDGVLWHIANGEVRVLGSIHRAGEAAPDAPERLS